MKRDPFTLMSGMVPGAYHPSTSVVPTHEVNANIDADRQVHEAVKAALVAEGVRLKKIAEDAQRQLNEAKTIIEYYANEEHYEDHSGVGCSDPECCGDNGPEYAILNDAGQKAREWLEKNK